jgi:small subunit ribosomal protein S9
MKQLAHASGKRKTAVARATIKKGNGKVRINKIPLEIFTPELARLKIMEPLKILGDRTTGVDIDINVKGGGVMGRADASRTAVAKALVDFFGDEELKKTFLQYDRTLLVSDTRRKLPKKPMGRGARKKRQKSYR